ncbi:MAG: thioredoxin family protein [candidate division WOR-3 bacterium]
MLSFLVFGKTGCPICKKVYQKIEYFKNKYLPEGKVIYYDLETVDGLAEGSYRDISEVPTVLLEKDGEEIGRWEKIPPTYKNLRELLNL